MRVAKAKNAVQRREISVIEYFANVPPGTTIINILIINLSSCLMLWSASSWIKICLENAHFWTFRQFSVGIVQQQQKKATNLVSHSSSSGLKWTYQSRSHVCIRIMHGISIKKPRGNSLYTLIFPSVIPAPKQLRLSRLVRDGGWKTVDWNV